MDVIDKNVPKGKGLFLSKPLINDIKSHIISAEKAEINITIRILISAIQKPKIKINCKSPQPNACLLVTNFVIINIKERQPKPNIIPSKFEIILPKMSKYIVIIKKIETDSSKGMIKYFLSIIAIASNKLDTKLKYIAS